MEVFALFFCDPEVVSLLTENKCGDAARGQCSWTGPAASGKGLALLRSDPRLCDRPSLLGHRCLQIPEGL